MMRLVITIAETDAGVQIFQQWAERSGMTQREHAVSVMMDRVVNSALSEISRRLQTTSGAESIMGSGDALDVAIVNAMRASLAE